MNRLRELTIAVMAKECLPGRVKTRLSPPLTAAQAARLAQLSLSQTLALVRRFAPRQQLLVFDGTPEPADAAGFRLLQQVPGSLDVRLAAICAAVPGPLLILGMDTPQLQLSEFNQLLEDWADPRPQFDGWLGLAADGGFWALALANPQPEHLLGVPMSTERTGTDQYQRLLDAGLSVGMLPRLRDVDYFDDARQAARQCAGSAFAEFVFELETLLDLNSSQ
ncbi:TIGR04282 family arsenosugar biosynthesis glycosyltransferase [Psychromicrobium lacuslunae]|uniref:Glycosyltransferase n=1 Tax=Psychromicrobium lacuslunae TaxID=1618207 RepID=A0A0D4BWT3_9MICC|nr:DUF2064 domain-containing protein [Psychromicrobium lacuslunae]AJT40561.1 glycosyltransferase [Psychromicrobium lacuslunae]